MSEFDWDKFFEDWRKEYKINVFAKDGIICQEKYENILFILKDVNNCTVEDNPDLRVSLVTRTDEGKTWFNVCRWIVALLDGVPYSGYVDKMNSAKQHEIIKRAAAVNLKKEAGGPSVSDEVVKCYAKKHREKLVEQIEVCDPNIIVVCGVNIFDAALEVLGEMTPFATERPKFEMAKNWAMGTVKVKGKDVPIIQFRHPSNRCPAEKSYNEMLLIREYINKNI